MKKNKTTWGWGYTVRGILFFSVLAVVTTSEAKWFDWSKKEKVAAKTENIGTKQALETVLFLQNQKKLTDAANKIDQLATENKLLSDFSAVDQNVKMIAGFAQSKDQTIDYYVSFKDELEKELKRNGFDLSYDQLCSGTRSRIPRPTGQASPGTPSIEQIIATAVNETIKRLSQTGSLSLRWLTVRDGATFLGPVTFKSDIDIDANVEIDGSLTVGENLTVKGNTTLGDDDSDTVVIHAATSINTTGAAATAIGNSGTTTTILGATSVNATGSAATNIATAGTGAVNIASTSGAHAVAIGNASSTTTLLGTTNVNTSGSAATTVGNGTAVVKVDTANTNVATHVEINGSSTPIGLRIIRGTIDGISPTGISEGQGFTFTVIGTGHYRITFDTAFADVPSIVATTIDSSNTIARVDSLTTSTADIKTFAMNGTTATSAEFCFMAMGPTGA